MNVLYLVRHGVAVDASPDTVPRDRDRYLSEVGIKRTRTAARGLNQILELFPDIILTSPLVRAKQTAHILAEELSSEEDVKEDPVLEPGSMPSSVLKRCAELECTSIMAVGHMPDLAMTASCALSGGEHLDIEFKKAAMCCIRFYHGIQPGEGQLEWLLQPRQLRALAP